MKGEYEAFLISLTVNGIKNIDKDVTLYFVNKSIRTFNNKKSRIKAIYGENGVGKSAIITAVSILKGLYSEEEYLSSYENKIKLNNLINKKTKKLKIELEFAISDGSAKTIYDYLLEISETGKDLVISKEELKYRKLTGAYYNDVFKIKNGVIEYVKCDESYKDFIEKKTLNLLLKQSFVIRFMIMMAKTTESRVEEIENHNGILCAAVMSCLNVIGRKIAVYIDEKDSHDYFAINEIIRENSKESELFEFALTRRASSRISCSKDVRIRKKEFSDFTKIIGKMEKFIRIFKPELKSISIDKKTVKSDYLCRLVFDYPDYSIDGEFESTGVKKLVELFTAMKAVERGSIVFIDEFDANIHDYYLCKLLEYAAEYTNGQLIFTTHNIGPMSVLKKYNKPIDFLSRDHEIVPWVKNGNYDVASLYRQGKIYKSPFNLEAFTFLGIFGDEND